MPSTSLGHLLLKENVILDILQSLILVSLRFFDSPNYDKGKYFNACIV